MDRKASQNPDAHRALVVTDPPQEGRDIANLNRAVHARLEARGLVDDVPSPQHDKFTFAAALAAIEAGYFLGALSDTYLARDSKGRRVCSAGMQALIREPDKRTPEQLSRAKARQGQLDRGPRYYDELAANHGVQPGHGVAAALAWAAKQVGTVEHPSGSNWGPKIEDWIRLAGYTSPIPWCGAAANAIVMAGGVSSGAGWIGFTPAIIRHAQAGTGGWSWHSEGQPGDLILFDTPGGDIAVHVGTVKQRVAAGRYKTFEGNTSPPNGNGSQANGGGFWERDRVSVPSFRIAGFARPPYKR